MQPASEGKLTLVRATLQSETPVPGVELCPYVMCRRRDGSVTSDDIAKGSQAALDEGFYTRCVWHRSLGQRKTSYCSVNPERKATIQCVISQKLMKKLRELIANTGGAAGEASNGASANGVVHSEATSLLRKLTLMSFHCSPGCFERAWARHREEYRRASAEYIRLIQLAGPVASGSRTARLFRAAPGRGPAKTARKAVVGSCDTTPKPAVLFFPPVFFLHFLRFCGV